VSTQRFVGDADGRVAGLVIAEVDEKFNPIEGTEKELPAQLVLLAMGFLGPEKGELLDGLEVELDARSNVARSTEWMTNVDGVFVCGDMGRGQSLIVWAIAEGRSCAAAVDRWLMGDTQLPSPVLTTDRPIA
jgi:glutamate synthase (NADPH/NADH) small chain